MSTIIKLPNGQQAYILNREIKADTPELADDLMLDLAGFDVVSGADPDPDLTIATYLISLRGGEIVGNYPEEGDADIPEDAVF